MRRPIGPDGPCFTQVDAARRLRRNQSYVSKSESGDRRVDVVEVQAFARLYQKPLGFFFDPSRS